jgi:hypothetical protein
MTFDGRADFGSVMLILSVGVRRGRAIGRVCKPEALGFESRTLHLQKNLFAGLSAARFHHRQQRCSAVRAEVDGEFSETGGSSAPIVRSDFAQMLARACTHRGQMTEPLDERTADCSSSVVLRGTCASASPTGEVNDVRVRSPLLQRW